MTEAELLARDIERLNKQLGMEAATFGMTAREAKLYSLEVRGATQSQLEFSKTLLEEADAKDKSQRMQAKMVQGMEGVSRVGGLIASTVTKNMQKGFTSVADTMSTISQTASLIPGPVGAAASAVTGLLGAAITAINFRWEQMVARVDQATGSVLNGSRTMRQSLQEIGVSALTEEFTTLTQAITRAANSSSFVGQIQQQWMAANPNAANAMVNEDINNAMTRATNAERAAERMMATPAFEQMNTRLAARRMVSSTVAATTAAEVSATGATVQAEALAGGATTEQASDMAARNALRETMIQQIRREGESREQVVARINQSLNGQNQDASLRARINEYQQRLVQLTAAQGAALAANANLQLQQANTAGTLQLMQSSIQLNNLRDQRNTLIPIVDQSAQLVELQRLRANGASDAVVQARREQLLLERTAAQERARAQYVSQSMQQNRRPLETMNLEMQRLNDARDEFTDPQQFDREQARIITAMINSAGPLERLSGVFEQGTAATASAIRRAEVEQRGADPLTQLPAAMRALQTLAEEQNRYQARVASAVEQLGPLGQIP